MGLTKKTIMVEYEEKLKTAYHEIGHCLAALLSKGTFKIHNVTILPRGDSLG
jgi:ATP-dependent Zn protease